MNDLMIQLNAPATKVRAQFARRDNEEGTAPDWRAPQEVTLGVKRYPASRKRGQLTQPVVTQIWVTDFDWAEYTSDDYCGNGEFLAEEYRMRILEVLR